MSVNLLKLPNIFQLNVFIFENKGRTGYDINITKENFLVAPLRMVRLINQKRILNLAKYYEGVFLRK